MAWYTEYLIRNAAFIKAAASLDDDNFNNLLVLENKVDEMLSKGTLDKEELGIINFLILGFTMNEISEKLNSDRTVIYKKIKSISDKIAFYLGGEFTDDGYLNYMQEKYNLSNEQLILAQEYLKGNHKAQTAREKLDDTKQ